MRFYYFVQMIATVWAYLFELSTIKPEAKGRFLEKINFALNN